MLHAFFYEHVLQLAFAFTPVVKVELVKFFREVRSVTSGPVGRLDACDADVAVSYVLRLRAWNSHTTGSG